MAFPSWTPMRSPTCRAKGERSPSRRLRRLRRKILDAHVAKLPKLQDRTKRKLPRHSELLIKNVFFVSTTLESQDSVVSLDMPELKQREEIYSPSSPFPTRHLFHSPHHRGIQLHHKHLALILIGTTNNSEPALRHQSPERILQPHQQHTPSAREINPPS